MAPGLLIGSDHRVRTPDSSSCVYEHSLSSDVHTQDKIEPIAIIGFSLKFPQEATSSSALWQMLVEGRSAFSDFPKDRFNFEAFYHPDQGRPDTVRVDRNISFALKLLIQAG